MKARRISTKARMPAKCIRTTLNIYGDVVTDEMAQAHSKVVGLPLPRKVIAN